MAKTSQPQADAASARPYIKSVRLRNVPPLRDVKADFKPGLNIIIGKNGSGKTRFLQLASELVELHEVKYRGAGCELVLGGIKPEVRVAFEAPAATKKGLGLPRPSTGLVPLMVQVAAGQETHAADTLFGAAALDNVAYFEYQPVVVGHGIPAQRLPLVDEGLDISVNGSGNIQLPSIPQTVGSLTLLARLLIDALAAYYYQFASPAGDIELETVRHFTERAVLIHLSRLNDYLPVYSPIQAVRLGAQFQVYRNTVQEEVLVKGLALEYCVSGDWLPFGALSDGTKRLFYIIGELTAASYSFFLPEQLGFDFLDLDKIIFLEEPELGIHPDQLQLLLQFIREVSKESQVIMTTHSPQTLDMLTAQELDRITICDYVPGKGTQMRKLSPAKRAKAKAYLKDEGFLSEFWRFSNLEAVD